LSRSVLITVIGNSAKDPRDPVPEQAMHRAEEVGRLIAEASGVVVTRRLPGD